MARRLFSVDLQAGGRAGITAKGVFTPNSHLVCAPTGHVLFTKILIKLEVPKTFQGHHALKKKKKKGTDDGAKAKPKTKL